MKSSLPSVSIVIPCYNDSKYIETAVESAYSQKLENLEIIIVDDGSDEKTKLVLQSLRSKINKIITQTNLGVSAARNAGIKESSGDYILVLDSDDFFEPGFCKKALRAFQTGDNVRLVTCYAKWFIDSTNYQIHKPAGGELKNFLYRNSALSNSMFLKKDWRKVGGYDESMKDGWEDWEFFIRLHKDGGNTIVIPEVLFHYRMKKKSKTSIANQNRYDLLNCILEKHSDLYKDRFSETITYLINELKKEEAARKRVQKKMDYKIGRFVLSPVRFLRSLY
ncbi:hypothetical protein DET49_10770 [Salegentibacter sp. 24]|uniref:glycosyltransferase family 2 protein n=1 Tax=Salegentibacter sp. 24 TaxID=2183986 RepID=UPI00105F577C|nr:glycosyltransferase family A protein [Salegentibacter sp. 24]TDN89154.1 hypothetical protein DET49_10770 [Salegentibacter sp. 24]